MASERFGASLRDWRNMRGFSQLELGLDANVSARHISFLETGRSQPSRTMILRLADSLGLPLRERNDLMLAAGFAPSYGERSLEDDALAPVRAALHFILRMNEPFPAFVQDREWNIVLWNRTHEALISQLLPGHDVSRMNAFELVFDDTLLRDRLANWDEVAAALLRRLRRQRATAGDSLTLERLWSMGTAAAEKAGILPLDPAAEAHAILIPLRFELEGRELSWFSTLATFGTARDVTVEELVIECFYPANDETRRTVEAIL